MATLTKLIPPGGNDRTGPHGLPVAPRPPADSLRPPPNLDPISQSAFDIIRAQLDAWGLSALYTDALDLIKQGLGNDAIVVQLQNTDAWRKRFAANEARRKKGLAVLSPAEYVATERQYQQIMRQAGLPAGFYDTADDLTKFLANDIAPQELQQRVARAQQIWLTTDQTKKDAWTRFYGLSDSAAIASIIDPAKALPIVEREAQAALLGAAAQRNSITVDRTRAEQLADLGVTEDAARQGYGDIGQAIQTDQAIAKRFGATLDQSEEEDARLLGLASAQRKLRGLQQQESAQFGGRAAATNASVAQQTAGRF